MFQYTRAPPLPPLVLISQCWGGTGARWFGGIWNFARGHIFLTFSSINLSLDVLLLKSIIQTFVANYQLFTRCPKSPATPKYFFKRLPFPKKTSFLSCVTQAFKMSYHLISAYINILRRPVRDTLWTITNDNPRE